MDRNEFTPVVLTIAGLDPSGHAGILADIRTFTALDAFGSGVVTINTNQTEKEFYDVSPIPASTISQQLHQLFKNEKFDAVKIGMLYNAVNIEILSTVIKDYNPPHIVLDPIITSSTGGVLLEKTAIPLLKSKLIPYVEVLTPNVPEAEHLTGINIFSIEDMKRAGKQLLELGCQAVLVKGGHLKENAIDVFVDKNDVILLEGKYLKSRDFRGTGCVLSSAIVVFLAKGYDVISSVKKAKNFVEKARSQSLQTGKGHQVLNIFSSIK